MLSLPPVQTSYVSITGSVFALIAVLHLLRLVYGWEASIGGWVVPTWLSVVALLVSGCIALWALRLGTRG